MSARGRLTLVFALAATAIAFWFFVLDGDDTDPELQELIRIAQQEAREDTRRGVPSWRAFADSSWGFAEVDPTTGLKRSYVFRDRTLPFAVSAAPLTAYNDEIERALAAGEIPEDLTYRRFFIDADDIARAPTRFREAGSYRTPAGLIIVERSGLEVTVTHEPPSESGGTIHEFRLPPPTDEILVIANRGVLVALSGDVATVFCLRDGTCVQDLSR